MERSSMAITELRSVETVGSMSTLSRAKSFQRSPLRTWRRDAFANEKDAMRTKLHWIEGPWLGRLAIMPRPRGGDWLEEEIQAWRRSGVEVVVSLLMPDERDELNLVEEGSLCRKSDIEFVSFPIIDRSVPASMDAFSNLMTELAGQLFNGKNIAVHCRQGIGRAGIVAICLLISSDIEQEAAVKRVGSARGCSVPETPEQRRWITNFAKSLVA